LFLVCRPIGGYTSLELFYKQINKQTKNKTKTTKKNNKKQKQNKKQTKQKQTNKQNHTKARAEKTSQDYYLRENKTES